MIKITKYDRDCFDSMLEVLHQERTNIAARHPSNEIHMIAGWANACVTEALIVAASEMSDSQIADWIVMTLTNALPKIRDRGARAACFGEAPPMAKTATAVKAKPKPKLAKKPAVPAKRTKRGR